MVGFRHTCSPALAILSLSFRVSCYILLLLWAGATISTQNTQFNVSALNLDACPCPSHLYSRVVCYLTTHYKKKNVGFIPELPKDKLPDSESDGCHCNAKWNAKSATLNHKYSRNIHTTKTRSKRTKLVFSSHLFFLSVWTFAFFSVRDMHSHLFHECHVMQALMLTTTRKQEEFKPGHTHKKCPRGYSCKDSLLPEYFCLSFGLNWSKHTYRH